MKINLILDEHSVASFSQIQFHLNPAAKHPENPVMLPGEAGQWDGLQITWPGTVLRDPDDGLFRCWYHSTEAVQKDRAQRQPPFPWEPGYAESTDGIHWTKPDLGQSRHRELPTNRFTNDFDGWCISVAFRNPDRSNPEKRFLSIWKTKDSFTVPQMPRALASSPDGKLWRLEDPAFYKETPPRHQMQDFWQVMFDPADPNPEFRIKAYSQYWDKRSWDGALVRQIGLHHGLDLRSLRDHEPGVILAPEQGIDEEIHFASVSKVGQTYLMLFESDRFSTKPLHGDLRLAVSDDGRKFRRVHKRSPLVATGPKGMWDENLLVTTSYSMLEMGDEIWIYYFGCPNVYRNWPHGGVYRALFFYPTYLGLATLPRDRYAYAAGPGTLTTRPLAIGSEGVWINADGDNVQVAALDQSGKTVAEGRLGEERRMSVYRKIPWKALPVGEYSLRVTLGSGCRVYSMGH